MNFDSNILYNKHIDNSSSIINNNISPPINGQLHIAPMIRITDNHFRTFMRLFSKNVYLWTEMIVDNTIQYYPSAIDKILSFHPSQHPIVCQLASSNPTILGEVSKIVEKFGYDEINLNIGCPSNRALHGRFGVCLMKECELVRDLVYSIQRQVQIPITVKTRIGVDEYNSFEFLHNFIQTVSTANCKRFILHARNAKLDGFDPRKNRSIPPLNYQRVYDITKSFPDIEFIINGGITSLRQAKSLIEESYNHSDSTEKHNLLDVKNNTQLVGAMIGRAAFSNPCLFAEADTFMYGSKHNPPTAFSRRTILQGYISYLEDLYIEPLSSHKLHFVLKPLINLFHGLEGSGIFHKLMDKVIQKSSPHHQDSLPYQILTLCIEELNELYPNILDIPL